MQFSLIRSCLLALAASVSVVVAQTANFDVITSPVQDQKIAAGSTFTITWTPSTAYTGTISIVLLQGASNTTLQTGPQVATSIPSSQGSFDWTIPSSYGTYAVYGLKLSLDASPTIFQYSFDFEITGSSVTVTGSPSTVTAQISQISTLSSTSTVVSNSSISSNATLSSNSSTYYNYSSTSFSATATTSTKVILTTASATTAGAASSTSAAASATSSSAAMTGAAIGGTSLMAGLMVAMGLML